MNIFFWLHALIALRHKLEISFWDCFRFCLCNECIAVISYLAHKPQNSLRLQLIIFFIVSYCFVFEIFHTLQTETFFCYVLKKEHPEEPIFTHIWGGDKEKEHPEEDHFTCFFVFWHWKYLFVWRNMNRGPNTVHESGEEILHIG